MSIEPSRAHGQSAPDSVDNLRYLGLHRLDDGLQLGAEFVGAGRVAPLGAEVGHHGLQHLGQDGGGGLGVEEDHDMTIEGITSLFFRSRLSSFRRLPPA